MAQDYEQLEELLTSNKAAGSAAEVHGYATGWIASGTSWQSAADSFYQAMEVPLSGDLSTMMTTLAESTKAGLADVDFGFALFLPEDNRGINLRRFALSEWCRGFLAGFGLTGRFQEVELSDEVKELLRDFGQIAQVEEELPDDEDNESDLTEITEYVRMGAIMVYTDCATKAVH